MTAERVFVLGVGAQRSGTTWLHSYLTNQRHAYFGPLKEYHVFDVLHINCCRNLNANDELGWQTRGGWRRRAKAKELRQKLRARPEEYFKYFDTILRRQDVNLTGDITPSYAGLPANIFHEIKTQFNDRGIQVKVVFIMRDPVARCVSQALMWMRDKPALFAGRSFESALRELSRSDAFEMRTSYGLTIETLKMVFPCEDVFLTTFEELLCGDLSELYRLTDFLGLELIEELRSRQVNATPTGIDVSISTVRGIAEHYREVYEYVDHNIFRVGNIWDNASFVI
jgi:hypothetical protein